MRILLVTSASTAALLFGGTVQAQTVQDDKAIPTVVVSDESKASAAYSFGDPINSGQTTFDADSIRDRAPGSGDVNQLLKLAPTVQFSATDGSATREALQDIRPAQISISGASPLDNLFILDGVGVSSRLYTSEGVQGIDNTSNGAVQGVWVDSSLIGKLTLLDSNISAEYGGFLGGVVDVETRAPGMTYGMSAYYGLTNTDMASFRMSESSRNALGGVVPDKPDYEKTRYGFSADLPTNERLRLLAAYSYSDSAVTYFRTAGYLDPTFGQMSRSENYLLKAEYDLSPNLVLDGQIAWAPYESTNAAAASIDSLMHQKGGGLTTKTRLKGRTGEADWSVQLSYTDMDSSREAPSPNYSLPRGGRGVDWCDRTTCTKGSFGDINQNQTTYGLKGQWTQPLGAGELRAGIDVSQIDVMRNRPQDNYAFQDGRVSALTRCADPAEEAALTCVPGSYALARMQIYRAYRTEVDLQSYGLWSEYAFDWAGFNVRAGLRYDYESYLQNHSLAPRLSIARDLPWAGMTATFGVNRYYRDSFLGYAVREKSLQTEQYTRTAVNNLWSDNWRQTGDTTLKRYSRSDLATPYSDEVTAAVQGDLLGGRFRVKGVLRYGKNQFASVESREPYVNELGQTATRVVARPTNDGSSDYRGLSLEWNRAFGRHSLGLNTNFARSRSSNLDFLDDALELEGEDLVYYDGKVVTLLQALSENQREDFASPIIVNADWASTWFDGRVVTNVNARFKDEFQRVEVAGRTILVEGSRYDVYEAVTYDASVDVNLAVQAEIARTQYGTATLDLRVNNLFDTVRNSNSTSTSQPYQLGRNLWVSVKYAF